MGVSASIDAYSSFLSGVIVIVRQEQIDRMGESMQRGFEIRMIAHLRATFPQPTRQQTDDQMTAFVRLGSNRSRPYGITAEGDVQRYLEYMVMYGPEFDTSCAWASEILNTEGISGTKKMDWIDDYDQFVLNRS